MPLRDQADIYLSRQGGSNLVNAGPYCQSIAQSIQQNDTIATPLLAGIFWQAFINSDAFNAVLRSAIQPGFDPALLNAVLDPTHSTQLDTLIVRHGSGRWPLQDLLIFVHNADQNLTPIGIRDIGRIMQRQNISINVLVGGWRRFIRNQQGLGQIIRNEGGLAAVEILQLQEFHILIAPRPRIEYTAAFAPSPPLAIIAPDGYQMSTGIYVDHKDGRKGITTSLHAIEKFYHVQILNDTFMVGHSDRSPVTDSCFIEIPPGAQLRQYFRQPLKPLVGVAPAVGALMNFERVNQGTQSATIVAVDIGIPWFTHPPNQVKVYTDPVTAPGDSGTPLLNDQVDTVVGFCFWRFVGPFSAGAWIWAESVFIALNLRY